MLNWRVADGSDVKGSRGPQHNALERNCTKQAIHSIHRAPSICVCNHWHNLESAKSD